MQVKTVNATDADKASAVVLFKTLFGMRELFWPTVRLSHSLRVLEPFARNGQLTIKSYCDDYNVIVEAWELNKEHLPALKAMPAVYSTSIGCSYGLLAKYFDRLAAVPPDVVVIDTPQGIHHDENNSPYVEHFDFLQAVFTLFKKSGGVVVLYVNLDPYDAKAQGEHGYDTYKEYDFVEWQKKRALYYHGTSTVVPLTASCALTKYEAEAKLFNLKLSLPLMVPCYSDVPGKDPYAFQLAFRVDPV